MAYYHLFWDNKNQTPYAVKSGFSFPAFFFGMFYFLYHRAWISCLVFFLANICLTALLAIVIPSNMVVFFVSFAFNLYVGFDAADCLFGEYHKKGFDYIKSDFFTSKEHALSSIFHLKNVA